MLLMLIPCASEQELCSRACFSSRERAESADIIHYHDHDIMHRIYYSNVLVYSFDKSKYAIRRGGIVLDVW